MKLTLDDPLKMNSCDTEDNDAEFNIHGLQSDPHSSEGLSSIFSLYMVSLDINHPPEDEDDREEDAGAKEATSASIEPLAAATCEPLSRTRLTLLTLLTPPVLVIVKARSVNT